MSVIIKPKSSSYHVLYVDDEPHLLEIGKLFLEQRWKFEVTTVQSAKEALVNLRSNQYDAIVSDYQMPDMDGIELLQEIRSQYCDLPFILFTGRGREEVVIKALNAGADFYLQKGGDPKAQFAELAHNLQQAVQKKQAEEDRLHAEQALAESEEMFHTIFDSSPYPITIISCHDSRIQTINPAFLNLCRYREREVIGKTLCELGLFSEHHTHWFNALCLSHSAAGNIPVTLTGKTGEEIETLISTTPVTIKGSPSLLTIIVDITQQKRIIEEINQKNEELHTAYEQLASTEEELRANFDELSLSERELRASEKKFRALVENSLEGIIIINFSGELLFLNQAASRLVDIDAYQSLIGKNVKEFLSPKCQEEIQQNIDQVVLGRKIHFSRYQLISASNREVWVESLGKCIRFKRLQAILISIRDVTERKFTEDSLQESELKFSTIFRESPISLTLFSVPDNHFLDVNDRFLEETGYSYEEVIHKSPQNISLFQDPSLSEKIGTFLRTNIPINGMEIACRRKNGEIYTCLLSCSMLSIRGKPHLLTTIEDISERKQTENALKESESKFCSVFRNSPVPLTLVCAEDGVIMDVNSAFERETGFINREVIGNNIDNLNLFSDTEEYTQFVSTLRTARFVNGMEIKCKRKNGEIRNCRISSTLISLDQKPHILSSIEDITEQKKIGRIVKENEEKFRFLVECSHEGILLTDKQGIILYANETAVQMIDFNESSDIIGKNVLEFITEESRNDVLQSYQLAGTKNETQFAHYKIITRTGRQIYIESAGRMHTYEGTPAVLISIRNITDRKLADEALKTSEQRFRAVCDNAGSWIWEIDPDGIYRYSSPAVEEILGYRPNEIIGKIRFSDLLDPDTREDPLNNSPFSNTNSTPIKDYIHIFTHKSGIPVVLNTSSTPAYDKTGRVLGYYGVSENITKRKVTESEFQKLVGTLVRKTGITSIRNISKILCSWLQADCVIVGKLTQDHSCVKAISMILDGNEVSDGSYLLPGTPCEKTCEQEFHICTDNVIAKFPNAGILKQFQFKGYCGTPVRNSEGKPIGVLCVLSRNPLQPPEGVKEVMDIIAGKAGAEIERAQIEDTLRESEEKFRMLVHLSLDGIIIINSGGMLLFGNQAAGKMFEIDIQAIIASGPQNILEFVTPESREQVIYEIGHVTEVTEPYTVDYQAVTATGREIWIEGIGKEIIFHGSPAILLSLRDITLRKQMEDALLRKNKQLNLLSSITRHDILNMIMVIQGSLEIIEMDCSDPGLAQYIQKMRSASHTIKTQIEFTQFYQNMSSHAAQWVDLASCMPSDLVPDTISMSIDISGIKVYADQMLEKIFFNLLDNSIRHGLVVTTIRIGYYLDGENLIVLWEDNGIGIPEDQKDRVFELGVGKNTGFGLFLVREILSLTGITIRETGKPGVGTRFELTLPKGTYQFTESFHTN